MNDHQTKPLHASIEPGSSPRREFLRASCRYGFTAAVMGLAGGYLLDGVAMAQTAADEERKHKAAKVQKTRAETEKISAEIVQIGVEWVALLVDKRVGPGRRHQLVDRGHVGDDSGGERGVRHPDRIAIERGVE